MPGGLNGAALKQGLITAAPMFSAMAAGYASGRGPYAYMDQGAAAIQEQLKRKRDEEAARAASEAFGGLIPGGMGMSSKGYPGGAGFSWNRPEPMPKADPGVYGAQGGLSFPGMPKADSGVMGAQGGLGYHIPGGDPTLALIKQFEGFRETPYWDVNALRTGYGSDTVTLSDGTVQRVGDGTRVSREDADRDLQRRVQTEFMPIAAKAVGEDLFNSLAPNQKAALTSITYNYGKLPASVAAAVRSGDPQAAADAIVALGSHNDGINAGRRAQEARFYLAGDTGGDITMSAQNGGPADPMADPYVQRLMQVMAMPGLTPQQQAVVQLQLQNRMDMLTMPQPGAEEEAARARRARDADLLGYQRGSPEWNQYVVTGEVASPEQTPAGYRELELRARAAGLKPGTPEYQQFMQSGGGGIGESRPAAFEALHLQALAAGFPEGSDEYMNFMATRGAGLAAESKAMGEARGTAIAAAPAEVQAADETLGFIDEVRNHPGRSIGLGMTSIGNAIPGTSGYDFQNRVNQLKSGAFLTAIDQLRGMGALSNAEGQTATAAIARLDTATSEDEFLEALADYERVVKAGRDRAAKRIAPDGGSAIPTPAPVVIDGFTIEAVP